MKSNSGNFRQISPQQSDQVKKFYFQTVEDPKEFINGKEYLSYYYRSNTTPLIFSAKELSAVLCVNGRQYMNVRLQYDTFLDEVIYTDTSQMINFQFPKIALNKDIVQGFSFLMDYDTLNFRNLKFSQKSGNEIPDGFYEVAREGRSSLIIRHRSKQYRNQAVYEYDYSPVMYVSLGNDYVKIKGKKEFLLMFGEYSPQIKVYLKVSKIRIPQAGKKDIIRVLRYYDSILNSESGS